MAFLPSHGQFADYLASLEMANAVDEPAPAPPEDPGWKPGPYECERCSVAGAGAECWLCGKDDRLTKKFSVPSPGAQPQTLCTIGQLLDERTDKEIHDELLHS